MKTFNGFPLYEGFVDEDEAGMYCISLVDCPATESNFLFFGKDAEPVMFSIQDADKHIVRGLLMGAEQPIYRIGPSGYEYYIKYSAETLRLMAEKYLKNGFSSNVDLNHDGNPVEGVDMVQLFIKDKANGIDPKGFEEYADGSLFVEFKVNNEEVWQQIKDGDFKGFSLAGFFEVKEAFANIDNKQNNKKLSMKIEKIKEMLRKILVSFGSIATDKGTIVWSTDEDLKEGDAVHGVDEEGNEIDLEDGVYNTEDNKAITIAEGKVVSIEDLEAEVAPEAETEPEAQENEEETAPEAEPETDERDARIAELEARVAELEAENDTLKARIAELEGESAADSAEEEFKKTEDTMSPKMKDMIKRGYKFGN